MAALLKLAPVSQVTYGTDYPYFPLDQNKDLEKLGLSAADVDAIESGNATRRESRRRASRAEGRHYDNCFNAGFRPRLSLVRRSRSPRPAR